MDVSNFETAIKLKEAGFPQPAVKPGQFWWFVRFPDGSAKKEVLCVVTEVYSGGVKQPGFKFVPIDGGEFEGRIECYAPTATDILPKFKGPDETVDFILYWSDGLFSAAMAYWLNDWTGIIAEHANAAEALALAWLDLEKEQAQ